MERQPETKQPPSKPRKAPKGQLQMRAGGRQAVGVEVDENRRVRIQQLKTAGRSKGGIIG